MESQRKFPRTFSFEFFPPNTPEGQEKLRATTRQLAQLNPKFFSVTFGAGGSTRDRTLGTVLDIRGMGHAAAPHISCIASTRDSIREWLQRYQDHGIKHLVALRGDLPSGIAASGEFRYANELVEFIRKEFNDTFLIEVAAYPEYHPQAKSAQDDLLAFKRKIEAGADAAITQYFYNADAYYHFVDACEAMGLDIPIVPGIMPIGRFSQLARFSDACGAEIPRWIRKKLEGYGDDTASIRAFGLDVVTELCDNLLRAGAPGLHFYTLNQAGLTTTIWQRLGL
ncbi:MAG: methylenetetrahydrofolate reductase [NAD(P)H] [Betaproteobacteria bacterium]|nr:methylenetetrahydrofolate reductase [NAD(P)H] [Betaproteobacteria bacterium]MBI2225185.1 methylenetetrahydrofolate reductase [NAD(P)H] [Betaproteobacteria bacterium]MBI2289235.1 methylenetetrahydrofolate reductase [NAD(P)H] [Betaproteobacteria bacterium]MBI3054675.1 methylenetetrahydrofolate reductase [NAD(P)H] [Betaproteobacteria bacterium]